MRATIQRVLNASVTVDWEVIGDIGPGLLVFLCALPDDEEATAAWLVRKIAKLRIFRDENGQMNRSLVDVGGACLVVSQFTLAAETKGNRPGFSKAADPSLAERLYEYSADQFRSLGVQVETGAFGAEMQVALVNDGPVTINLDTAIR